jgi:hypothetical protein
MTARVGAPALAGHGTRSVPATIRKRRRGAILIVALVCLLLVMALVALLLQGTLRARRQLRAERDRRQAEFLLTAGIERAAQRLAAEADYRGETWDLPAEAIVGTSTGQVTIRAARAEASDPWQVHVVAEYPLGSELSIRRTRTVLVSSPE